MEWNNSHKNPPEVGQKVYYFGPNIGLWIGEYSYVEGRSFKPFWHDENNNKVFDDKEIALCPHVFSCADGLGICDACDAPHWLPYDENRAKSWVPIIPKEYTKGIYDD